MYDEDDIDGPNEDIYDPLTDKLIAKKQSRKRKIKDRQYLALADLRSNDGIKRVSHYSNRSTQPGRNPQPVQQTAQNGNNALLRGRVNLAPLPSGGGQSDVPSNLQSYIHPSQQLAPQRSEDGYYRINGTNEDDIFQQIKQILFSITNSNHLSNVGIVGARHPATNDLGQKVDVLVGGQRPDSNELLTAGVDLNIDDGESRYQLLNDTMKRIFNGFTDISGLQPDEVESSSEGYSPFTEQGLSANVVPSGQQMINAWQNKKTRTVGKQRYKPISLVYVKGVHFGKGNNKVDPLVFTHYLTKGHMAGKNNTNQYRLLRVVPLHKNFLDKIGDALGSAVGSVTNLISSGVNDVLTVGNFVGQIAKVI